MHLATISSNTNSISKTARYIVGHFYSVFSVRGTLFLSIAVSTIQRQCSREAAFFHVQEEPKLSGLDSDEIRFTGSLLLQTYTVGPHTLNGYINDLTCRAAIAHSAVYLG